MVLTLADVILVFYTSIANAIVDKLGQLKILAAQGTDSAEGA